MKAKYFKKIRNQVKWYKVSYRDNLLFSFSDEKEILAKSPENACVRYHKRTGCFVNKYKPHIQSPFSLIRSSTSLLASSISSNEGMGIHMSHS